MSEKKTYIAMVLDRSGSMKYSRKATIDGYNKQIKTIHQDAKDNNGSVETFVSCYTFNHEVERHSQNVSVNFLQDMTEEEYVTVGNTALFDAMGTAIDDLANSTNPDDPNNAYLIVFISDGQEHPFNCSKKYNAKSVAKMIKDRQDSGNWTFTYLGANQDLSKVAEELGIPKGNLANYASTRSGTRYGQHLNSTKLDGFLKARSSTVGGTKFQMESFHSDKGEIADYREKAKEKASEFFDARAKHRLGIKNEKGKEYTLEERGYIPASDKMTPEESKKLWDSLPTTASLPEADWGKPKFD